MHLGMKGSQGNPGPVGKIGEPGLPGATGLSGPKGNIFVLLLKAQKHFLYLSMSVISFKIIVSVVFG